MAKYGLYISWRNQLGIHNIRHWNSFVSTDNAYLSTPDAIDFLDKLLRYDGLERLTAQEAMEHHYFDPIRKSAK